MHLRGAYDYVAFKVVIMWFCFGPIYFQLIKKKVEKIKRFFVVQSDSFFSLIRL